MSVDLSGHTEYFCRDCRSRCLRPAGSEEALRGRCIDCHRLDSLHDLSEVPLLDGLNLDWFLERLDEDQEGGPGMRPPSHGGSTRKPTASGRPQGRPERECGSAKRSDTQSNLTDFLTGGVHGD
jgi:hypothetical protein